MSASYDSYPFALNQGRTIYSSSRTTRFPSSHSPLIPSQQEERTTRTREHRVDIKPAEMPLRDLCPPQQEPLGLSREAIGLWEDPYPAPPGSCFPPSVFSSLEPTPADTIPTWVSAFSCIDFSLPEWASETDSTPTNIPYSSSTTTSRDCSPISTQDRKASKPYHRSKSTYDSDNPEHSNSRVDKKRKLCNTTTSQVGRSRLFPCTITGCSHACFSQADLARHLSSLAHSAATWRCRSSGCPMLMTRPDARKRHEQNKHPKERFSYPPNEGLVRGALESVKR